MSVLSHQEKYGHYGNAGEFSGDGTAFLDISAHLDTWVMTFGACPASQLATVLLFQIPGNSFDFLEEAWAQVKSSTT